MPDRYVAVDGAVLNFLGPEFDDLPAAVDFANNNGIAGTVQLVSTYQATPAAEAAKLGVLKAILKEGLKVEADRRIKLADPAASFEVGYALHLAGTVSALATIAAVVPATYAAVDAIPDVVTAEAYDVSVNPAWP